MKLTCVEVCLETGVLLMGFGMEIRVGNPDAVFSLGLGLSLPGMWDAQKFILSRFMRKVQ